MGWETRLAAWETAGDLVANETWMQDDLQVENLGISTVQQINFSNSNVRQMRFPRKVGGLNNIGMKVCVFVGFLKQYGGCMGAANHKS